MYGLLTSMRWRSPDKPIRIAQDALPSFDQENSYIATYKYDGWRCIIDWNGSELGFFSRRDPDLGGPTAHPVSESLRQECLAFFKTNDIPANTRLDAEWVARRTTGPEQLYIFGIQYLKGEWLGKDSEDLRFTIVETFKYNQPHVHLAEFARENYTEFFDKIKSRNESLPEGQQQVEGVVLKKLDCRMLGNLKTCKENPSWFKVKWRDGSSGYTPTF